MRQLSSSQLAGCVNDARDWREVLWGRALSTSGEHPLRPVGPQLGVVTTPPRFHCPRRGQPKPSWLPPDNFCCAQDHYLQGAYGITCDQWWELREHQGDRCGICRRRFKPGQRIVVDHDHDTGEIDSLAHFGCNRGLRQEHRRYAKNPPGAALGFRVAPAKLARIKAKDADKRRREAARRSRPTPAPAATTGRTFRENMRSARQAQQALERSD